MLFIIHFTRSAGGVCEISVLYHSTLFFMGSRVAQGDEQVNVIHVP